MAIIFTYPTLTNLAADDLLLISDVSVTGKPTKNITVQQIVDLIPGLVPGGGTVSSVGMNFQSTGLTVGGAQSQTITTTGSFNISGVLTQGHGGTGLSSYNTGQLLYTDSNSTISLLNPSSIGNVLTLDSNLLPVWSTASPSGVTQVSTTSSITGINLTSTPSPITGVGTIDISGTLPISNGGTGAITQQAALDAITDASSGLGNQVLTTDGTNASWASVSSGVTSWSGGSTGLRASGTDPGTGAVVMAGTLSVIAGGTGLDSFSGSDTGSMFWYNDSASTLALQKLGIGSVGQILTVISQGGTLQPAWSNSTAPSYTFENITGVDIAKLRLNDGTTSQDVSLIAGTGLSIGASSATSATFNLDVPVIATNGGTGKTAYAQGDILYADTTTTLDNLPIGNAEEVLKVSASGVPEWGISSSTLIPTLKVASATALVGDMILVDTTTTPTVTITLPSPTLNGQVIGIKWVDYTSYTADKVYVKTSAASETIDGIDRFTSTSQYLRLGSIYTYYEFIAHVYIDAGVTYKKWYIK
tara:strand:+ start:775 stop:2367 length:1593 start_codon:yes stop_codon:yes gene_type:complete